MQLTYCTLYPGVYTSEPLTRNRSDDFRQTCLLTRRVVSSICTSTWTPEDAKSCFLCNTLWAGENRKIERGRLQLNAASLSMHGSVTRPIKSHRTVTLTVPSATTAGRDHEFRSISVNYSFTARYRRQHTSLDPSVLLWDSSIWNKITSLNKEPVREHRETIRRGTRGRVNPKQHLLQIHRHPKLSK